MKSNASAREEEVQRFPGRYIDSGKSPIGECCDRIARYVMPFGRTFVITLPAVLISRFRSFAAILPTSPASGRLKRLAARVWLLNAKSVMRWSRSASTSARTRWFAQRSVLEAVARLYLFWRICSTIGSPRELIGPEQTFAVKGRSI